MKGKTQKHSGVSWRGDFLRRQCLYLPVKRGKRSYCSSCSRCSIQQTDVFLTEAVAMELRNRSQKSQMHIMSDRGGQQTRKKRNQNVANIESFRKSGKRDDKKIL